MKYIKMFDNLFDNLFDKNLYHVGNYILPNSALQLKLNNNMAQIIEVLKIGFSRTKHSYRYVIEFSNNQQAIIAEKEIIRLLTPKEIEEFELKKDTNKYNL